MKPQPTHQKRIILFIMSVALMGTLPLCIQLSALATRSNTLDATSSVQFNSATYMAGEGDGKVNITVTRSGGTTGAASVRYATSDGTAKEGKDYTAAFGALNFAAGETSKSFTVLIIDNGYAAGPRSVNLTLSNSTGADLSTPGTAVLTINDNDTVNGLNPLDQTQFFVQLHYYDFLSRYPDQAGWDFWTHNINSCTPQPSCTDAQRVNTSAAYFLSIEFQQTGYLVERIYKAAYGSAAGTSTFGGTHQLAVPVMRFNEFLPDTQQIGQGLIVGQTGWEQLLENNKQGFALDFVQRSRFMTAFPTSLTPSQFADQLFANAGVTPLPADRNAAIAEFGSVTSISDAGARARALRDVAENSVLQQQEFNRAFVLMQYFGYLRRNPNDVPDSDYTGFDFWLTKLNQFNGDYNAAEMVKAFIVSTEYRSRFGANATSSPTPMPTASATPTPTPTPGQGELTPEQSEATTEAVRAEFETLSSSGLSNDDVNQQLLNFIRSRPEFSDAGISTDSCVWATFTDGVGFIAYNNRDPNVQPGSMPQRETPRFALVNAKPEAVEVADLEWGLGPAFKDPTADLFEWLYDQNYGVTNVQATVESMRSVGTANERVLFLGGHGGPADLSAPYSVSTLTRVSAAKERADINLSTDLKTGRVLRVVEAYGRTANGRLTYEKEYAITSKFVQKYWGQFPPNSFVFNDACDSASPGAADFMNAIKAKGATVYAGWTGPSSEEETAKFVFDRLLGANKVYPESDGYKQRPFDYDSVKQDFQYHGVGKDPRYGARLVFKSLSGQPFPFGFQTLAPSIQRLEVDEQKDKVEISGIFDTGPSDHTVTVGGIELNNCQLDEIGVPLICDLPKSGAGEVIVSEHGHKSNPAYLSEWQGTFTHIVNGDASHTMTAKYNVRLRADIRKVRQAIHEPPKFSPLVVAPTADSTLSYECGGSYKGSGYTITWSGSGTSPRRQDPLVPDQGFWVEVSAQDDSRLLLGFSPGVATCLNTTTYDDGTSFSFNMYLLPPAVGPSLSNLNYADLDDSTNIIENFLTGVDPAGQYLHTLKWGMIQNKYPPKPDSPR